MNRSLNYLIYTFYTCIILCSNIAFAQTSVDSCQSLSSGEYVLTQDVSSTGNCFDITSSGITLDCAGHKITGDGSGAGVYINYKSNITVKNCEIANFENGIFLDTHSYNAILDSNVIHNNTTGIRLYVHCYDASIINNNIYENTGDGIFTGHHNYRTELRANNVSSNGANGINLTDWPENAVIIGNTANDNQQAGISVNSQFTQPYALVQDNTATGNQSINYGVDNFSVFENNVGSDTCGNGTCGEGESCSNCSSDCGSCEFCGDGSCNNGEDCSSCSSDCGSCGEYCGDGSCNNGEDCNSCSNDCGACTVNSISIASPYSGETIYSSYVTITGTSQQPYTNIYLNDNYSSLGSTQSDGNGNWSYSNTFYNGYHEIFAYTYDYSYSSTSSYFYVSTSSCGDYSCNNGEDCSSCPSDCGSCGEYCGDGSCNNGEDCSSCSNDCGNCGSCGNGSLESGEQCDDGNNNNGDGCNSICQNEDSCPDCALTIHVEGHPDVVVPCNIGDWSCQAHYVCNAVTGTECIWQQYDCSTGTSGSWYPPDGKSGSSNFNFAYAYDLASGSYGNICACDESQMARYGLASNHTYCGVGVWYRDGATGLCGNNTIDAGEQCDDGNTINGDSCSSGCQIETETCGNGVCGSGENCDSCSADCGSCEYCGDGSCNNGETCNSCSSDCGSCTDNSVTISSPSDSETLYNSLVVITGSTLQPYSNVYISDNYSSIGNTQSDANGYWSFSSTYYEGYHEITAHTNDYSYASDSVNFFVMLSSCGDNICSGGEDCNSCPGDCGVCGEYCGNGTCGEGETCASCEGDCGACSNNIYIDTPINDQKISSLLNIAGRTYPFTEVTIIIDDLTQTNIYSDEFGNWSAQIQQYPNFIDGAHTLSASYYDTLQSRTVTSELINFNWQIPPSKPAITNITNNSISKNSTQIFIGSSGSTEADTTIELFDADTDLLLGSIAATDGAWEITLNNLTEGLRKFKAQAVDQNSNRSDFSDIINLNLDYTLPAAPVIASPANNSAHIANSITVNGTAEAGTTVLAKINGNIVGTFVVDSNSTFSGLLSFTGVANIELIVVDPAGNVSASKNLNIELIDPRTISPEAPVLDQLNSIISEKEVIISGNAEPDLDIQILEGNSVLGTVRSDANGDFSLTYNFSEGLHYINAKAISSYGIYSNASEALEFEIDITKPEMPIVDETDNITHNNIIPLSGKAEPGSLITIIVNGNDYVTTTSDSSGNWFVDLQLPDLSGDYTIQVRVTDKAGNDSSLTEGKTIALSLLNSCNKANFDSFKLSIISKAKALRTYVLRAGRKSLNLNCLRKSKLVARLAKHKRDSRVLVDEIENILNTKLHNEVYQCEIAPYASNLVDIASIKFELRRRTLQLRYLTHQNLYCKSDKNLERPIKSASSRLQHQIRREVEVLAKNLYEF